VTTVFVSDTSYFITPDGVHEYDWRKKRLVDAAPDASRVWPHVFVATPVKAAASHVFFQRAPDQPAEAADDALRRLREHVGPNLVAVIDDEGPGWAHVSEDDSGNASDAAAAVVVFKAVCGWDETNPMTVQVSEARYRVEHALENGVWRAKVAPSSPEPGAGD